MARAKRSYGIGFTLAVIGVALGNVSPSAAVEVTTFAPRTGLGVERGIVLLRCRGDGANMWRISRGVVLDLGLGRADRDVVLTTAHGLSPRPEAVRRDCRILGAGDRTYRIEAAWRAAGGAGDSSRDWAVLLVNRKLHGDVDRLRPGQLTVDAMLRLAAQGAPVRLLSRNPALTQRDCNLLPIDDATLGARPEGPMMIYSCRSTPGLSGSPILANVEGRPLVIGIHVGWGFTWVAQGRVRAVSVGHVIDAQIAAALAAAAARARR